MPLFRNYLLIPLLFLIVWTAPGNTSEHDDYGSIAYSESDGKWGYSYNYSTRMEANRVALDHCLSSGGRSCEIVMQVSNGCGAVAAGRSSYGAETGLTRREAEQGALRKCNGYDSGCVIKVWVCTAR